MRWTRALGSVLTLSILPAVAILASGFLGTGLTPAAVQQVDTPDDVQVSVLDPAPAAPAATPAAQSDSVDIVLTNWSYTKRPYSRFR